MLCCTSLQLQRQCANSGKFKIETSNETTTRNKPTNEADQRKTNQGRKKECTGLNAQLMVFDEETHNALLRFVIVFNDFVH
jgi:hypothetical protein